MQSFTSVSLILWQSLAVASMPAEATDVKRAALLATSDFWFHWLIACTALVALGCLMELGEAVVEWLHWRKHRKGQMFQEDEARWTIPVSIAGVFFVIVGVCGEGYFEARQASAETAIREYDETALAQAMQQAGDAKQSALIAGAAAATAQSISDAAQKTAELAETAATKAHGSAADALRTAGEARGEIAAVQSDIAKVDAKYAPRMLSKIRKDILIKLLSESKAKPSGPVHIGYSVSASDGAAYANAIANTINDPATGWKAVVDGGSVTNGAGTGVALFAHDKYAAPTWGASLQQALKSAGILDGGTFVNPEMAPDNLTIFVEKKN